MTQNNEELKQIGRRLKEEREYRGFSKQDIAEYLGILEIEVEKIEDGQRKICSETFERLANFYNIPVRELRDNSENESPDEQIEFLTRSNDDLSEIDRGEIHRFAEFLKSRQCRGDSND